MQPTARTKIYIGPAGWSYPDWERIVYPPAKSRSFDPLKFLACYFNLIEINSTFYRTPSPGTCRRWIERVEENAGFVFTAKAPQDFTHRSIPASQREVAAFKTAIAPLFEKRRLASVLVQFPWSFRPGPSAMEYVTQLAEWLSPYPAAVEVRHGAWGAPQWVSQFRDAGIPLCGIDQPLVGDSLRPETRVTGGGRAYFRLHGRNRAAWFNPQAGRDERYDYLYDASELRPWRDTIREAAGSAETVLVVLNNHFRGQAVVNALQLQAMLTTGKADAPSHLLTSYPAAGDLLRPRDVPGMSPEKRKGEQFELFEDGNDQKHDDDPDKNR